MKSVREILGRDFGLDITDQHLTEMRVELMRKFREELKPIPGVSEMLPRLGVPCCVASSGTLDRIRYALDVTGLLGLLEPHLFSAAMVARGKPAPDLFLHAAASMGAHPAQLPRRRGQPGRHRGGAGGGHARLCLHRRLACRQPGA